MGTEIICTIITGVVSIVVTAMGINNVRHNKKTERHLALRRRENLLSLKMMDATLQLSVVTSNALTGGHNNGNVEKARETAEKVAKEYDEFLKEVTAHEIG